LSSRGWDLLLMCGGLDSSVEPAGEGSLETASDVAMGLALRGAFGVVGAGLGVAAHAGDRDGVKGPVEISVAATV
jgi:hypothetical protein